jgi:hypothetical protein
MPRSELLGGFETLFNHGPILERFFLVNKGLPRFSPTFTMLTGFSQATVFVAFVVIFGLSRHVD